MTIALARRHSDWLARLRTIQLGMGGRGALGVVGMGRSGVTSSGALGSLLFDNVDVVTAPEISVFTGLFTIDVYWRCPGVSFFAAWNKYGIVSSWAGGNGGWRITANVTGAPVTYIQLTFSMYNGTGSVVAVNSGTINISPGTWYYIRVRRRELNYIRMSHNAGSEFELYSIGHTPAPSGTPFRLNYHGSDQYGDGAMCYVHIMSSDRGALSAVPSSPLALLDDTILRYRFSDGAGGTLTDDSGNAFNGVITGATWTTDVAPGWS